MALDGLQQIVNAAWREVELGPIQNLLRFGEDALIPKDFPVGLLQLEKNCSGGALWVEQPRDQDICVKNELHARRCRRTAWISASISSGVMR